MNINDYLIDQADKDWATHLGDWIAPLSSSFTLWLVNRFGDVFIVADDDNSVHMLDVGAGTLTRVANDRSHFADLLDTADSANNWLMIPLVDVCRAVGMNLGPSQCYGFKIPPVLGGKYEVEILSRRTLQSTIHFWRRSTNKRRICRMELRSRPWFWSEG